MSKEHSWLKEVFEHAGKWNLEAILTRLEKAERKVIRLESKVEKLEELVIFYKKKLRRAKNK